MNLEETAESLAMLLKRMGYRKNRLVWRKQTDDIAILFWIQRSQYSKDVWYYLWGVYIPEIDESKNASSASCQIRYRAENRSLSDESVIRLVKKWEELYGSMRKLRVAALEGRLPADSTQEAVSYLTSVVLG